MKVKFLLFLLFMLVFVEKAASFDNGTLIYYFGMENSDGNVITDSVNGTLIKCSNNLISVTGINNNALYYANSGTTINCFNQTRFFYDNDFSVNFWVNNTGTTAGAGVLLGGADGEDYLRWDGSTKNITDILVHQKDFGFFNENALDRDNAPLLEHNKFNMITLSYNHSSKEYRTYYNAHQIRYYFISNPVYYFRGLNWTGVSFSAGATDELSIWNQTLTLSDIQILYNGGNSLSYAETVNSLSYTVPENPQYYYYDICWYGIVCKVYNITGDVCMDNVYKKCVDRFTLYDGCADTVSTYGLTPEVVNYNFSADCYPEQDAYTWIYPTFEATYNISLRYYYDYCYGLGTLCKLWNFTAPQSSSLDEKCPLYIDGSLNRIGCSIDKKCNDNSDQYTETLGVPPDGNFSGSCVQRGNVSSQCSNEGLFSCGKLLNMVYKCNADDNGVLKLVPQYYCPSGSVCNQGTCRPSNAIIPTSESGAELEDLIASIPMIYRYIILVTLVIIFFFLPLVFAGSDGVIGGLAISSILCLTLSIIFNLNLIIPIVYLIISAGIIAIMIKKTFV